MISNEDLKKVRDHTMSFGVMWDQLREMAQELLQRREAARAIWENAPEWANFYAEDENGTGTYHEFMPTALSATWRSIGRYDFVEKPNWQSTLQERPK